MWEASLSVRSLNQKGWEKDLERKRGKTLSRSDRRTWLQVSLFPSFLLNLPVPHFPGRKSRKLEPFFFFLSCLSWPWKYQSFFSPRRQMRALLEKNPFLCSESERGKKTEFKSRARRESGVGGEVIEDILLFLVSFLGRHSRFYTAIPF